MADGVVKGGLDLVGSVEFLIHAGHFAAGFLQLALETLQLDHIDNHGCGVRRELIRGRRDGVGAVGALGGPVALHDQARAKVRIVGVGERRRGLSREALHECVHGAGAGLALHGRLGLELLEESVYEAWSGGRISDLVAIADGAVRRRGLRFRLVRRKQIVASGRGERALDTLRIRGQ